MQPLLTQVPPNRLRSIIATFIPVSASRTARDGPAWPVPITIASYLVAIGIPPLGLCKSYVRSERYSPDLHACEYTGLFRTPGLRPCDIALIVPLLTLNAPDTVKSTLGVISGSWIQWWALPALQRSQNKTQAQNEAKAAVDHETLTYLAKLQDEQMTELKGIAEIL